MNIFNNSIIHSDVGVEIQYGDELAVFHNSIVIDLIGVYIGEGISSLSVIGNIVKDSRYFGILVYIYPLIFNFTSNIFFNNTLNFFYAYNSTLPNETTETTTIHKTASHNLPYILAIVIILLILFSLILRKRRR